MLTEFIIQYQKIIFNNNTTIRKVFKYWEAVRIVETNTSLPEFQFLLESLIFITGKKYYQLFSFSDGVLCSILRKHLPNNQD